MAIYVNKTKPTCLFLKNEQHYHKNGFHDKDYPKEYMFVVLLLIVNIASKIQTEVFRCTGSLIKPVWVLTAGHCLTHDNIMAHDVTAIRSKGDLSKYIQYRYNLKKKKNYTFAKEFDIEERKVIFYTIHPSFNTKKIYHNVALLKLKTSFSFFIRFPSLAMDRLRKPERNCTIVGFGIIENRKLFYDGFIRDYSNLTVSNPRLGCNPSAGAHHGDKNKIGPFVCFQVFLENLCPGDSGTPLICSGKIMGLATVHEQHAIIERDYDCHTHDDKWYYYNSIHYELRWINNVINNCNVLIEKKWLLAALVLLFAF